MTNRNQMGAYYSPPAYYGSSAYMQPANWFGDFVGNLGNSMQGGEDAPMYGGNSEGLPYATTGGAYQAGAAVSDAAGALVAPVGEFAKGLLRGVGVYVALGIIGYTLINAGKK